MTKTKHNLKKSIYKWVFRNLSIKQRIKVGYKYWKSGKFSAAKKAMKYLFKNKFNKIG